LDEETARAELYGLIAALFYAPPDEALLGQLRVAVTEAPAAGIETPAAEAAPATTPAAQE
jgi:TorA maturation chaperone TorD